VIVRCGNNTQPENTNQTAENKIDLADKGIGPFKDVKLTSPLDQEMATQGLFIFKTKCITCHKLSTEKLVGPGWKGVTQRRAPEWIMNYIINTDVMLDKNAIAQRLVQACVTRMPNQNLTAEEARNILEFMRKNDGKD
ncbi:MAG: c-type cytochrome, partial [Bacteroidota bacterium]